MRLHALTLAAVLTLLAAAPPVSAAESVRQQTSSRSFADVPSGHWGYADLDTLLKSNLVPSYPNGMTGVKRSLTRYEFAIAIGRVLDRLLLDDRYAPLRNPGGVSIDAEYANVLLRLTNEFAPELKVLGVRADRYAARLRALVRVVPPFSDVPEGHWAYPYVETARSQGILIGFADGRFYGNR